MKNNKVLEDAIDEFFLAGDTGVLDGGWIQAENIDLIAKNLYESQGDYTVNLARPESKAGREELKKKDKNVRKLLKQVRNTSRWEDSIPSLEALAGLGMKYSFNIWDHAKIDKGYGLLIALNNTSHDRSKSAVGHLDHGQKNVVLDTEHTAKLLFMIYNIKGPKKKEYVLQRVKKYAAAVATGALAALAFSVLFGGKPALPAGYVDCPPALAGQAAPAENVSELLPAESVQAYKAKPVIEELGPAPKHSCYGKDSEVIRIKGDSLGAFSRRYLECLDKNLNDEQVTYFAKGIAERNNKDVDAWTGRPCDNTNSWHCLEQGEEISDLHSAVTDFLKRYHLEILSIPKRG